MIAVGYLLGGRLFDVWQPEALVYIGGTLAIFFLFLLALFPKWPFLITFLALYGAGQGLWRSALLADYLFLFVIFLCRKTKII
ncbi:hypothetical protein LAC1533_1939 [Ligilactobacillus acidipiscis]|nr:hypothetical protein LAC1533_1939 [Ligilactobacillus acidipiscis]